MPCAACILLISGSGPTERQTISLNTDGESENESSVTHTKKESKDPTKLHVLPPKEAVQTRPFWDPMRAHPLPPRDRGGQGENDCTIFSLVVEQRLI